MRSARELWRFVARETCSFVSVCRASELSSVVAHQNESITRLRTQIRNRLNNWRQSRLSCSMWAPTFCCWPTPRDCVDICRLAKRGSSASFSLTSTLSKALRGRRCSMSSWSHSVARSIWRLTKRARMFSQCRQQQTRPICRPLLGERREMLYKKLEILFCPIFRICRDQCIES